MLTTQQRARILHHLEQGWKLPDSLVMELWIAYEELERAQPAAPAPVRNDERRRQGDQAIAAPEPQRAVT